MTKFHGILVTLLLALAPWSLRAAERAPVAVTIVAETIDPAPGQRVTLAVAFVPDPGWHGYWSNPGEAGFEPRFAWQAPGLRIGRPAFPVPRTLLVGGLMNYVYEGPHALLVTVTVPAAAPGTRLPIALKLDYLACTDKICVPQRAALSTMLTIGDARLDPLRRAQFDRWRAALPVPLGSQTRFERTGAVLRLAIPYPAAAALGSAHFFPAANGLIVDAGAQRFTRAGDLLIAELPAGITGGPVAGVLALGDGRGLTITAIAGAVPAAAAGQWVTALLALGGAVLGGLILNVMPCVFPIIGIKAMSLAKAGGDERAARRDAIGYTIGAVLVCVGLGAALIALRAAGSALGWAFQLQDPRVLVVLLILATAIALNFAGLFELPTIGGNLATGNSIATGALAAFVATPCTGPFMGAALGTALVLPPVAGIAIFAGLGLGLALPFLLLGFVPALRRRLPRPGVWMVTLRHWLAVPMFLTALALVWLLGRIGGTDVAAWGLGAAMIIGLLLWAIGMRQAAGQARAASITVALAAIVVLAVVALPPVSAAPVVATTLTTAPFSEARLAALRRAHQPVFVYFTADWCLTCKVNERVAIDRPEVAAAFKRANMATLVGDWTRADPVIGRFLAAQGRSGVPLYLYYAPDREARELPQVLTPSMLTALAP